MTQLNTVTPVTLSDGRIELPVKTFTVEVLINPPCYLIALGLAKMERKSVQIQGYTLKDAKKRAGIE
jgi:hypothetical protein